MLHNLTSREPVSYGDSQAHPSWFYAILQKLILYDSFTMTDKGEAIKILICFIVAPKIVYEIIQLYPESPRIYYILPEVNSYSPKVLFVHVKCEFMTIMPYLPL